MEGVVLFLVLFAAWPFGSVHANFQWVLLIGVGVLLACWAARIILVGQRMWVACPVAAVLAVLCLLAIAQVLPLNAEWVRRLSPATAELQDFMMPSPAELAAAGVTDDGTRTLSVDAAATRSYVLQLVAVLALFAVVRNNLRDPGTFYRLAWLAAINGVLLALVGMGQLASSPPNVVFWSYPTRGQVFGPFICRNHFAYYANLCLGLAAGLLLGTRYFLLPPRSGRGMRSGSAAARREWRELFRDPRSALARRLPGDPAGGAGGMPVARRRARPGGRRRRRPGLAAPPRRVATLADGRRCRARRRPARAVARPRPRQPALGSRLAR